MNQLIKNLKLEKQVNDLWDIAIITKDEELKEGIEWIEETAKEKGLTVGGFYKKITDDYNKRHSQGNVSPEKLN